MPCDYKKYPADWKEVRQRILARDRNCCKFCWAENGQPHWITGSIVVLTIAHLNHNIQDMRDYNLAALCQRCHNILDMPYRHKIKESAMQITFKSTKEVIISTLKLKDLELWFNQKHCLEAVKQDGYALMYVKDQSESICLEAVKRNGDALRYVNIKSSFLEIKA
jgi:hypothetical protein